MKPIASLVCAPLLVLALSGCTVTQSANYAVARYCWLPQDARAVTREAVALAVAPNRIEIHCHADQ